MDRDVMALALHQCQTRQADLCGYRSPVPDPDLAERAVVAQALAFADPIGKDLARRIVERQPALLDAECGFLQGSPLVASSRQLAQTAHLTAYDPLGALEDTSIVVMDRGLGSRMHLRDGQSKGSVEVLPGAPLFHYSAGAMAWCLEVLSNSDWIACSSSDQVVFLPEADRNALRTCLEVASGRADIVFFDGPPALSLTRLAPLLNTGMPPQHSSPAAVSRTWTLLTEYGGAHAYQAVFFRRQLLPVFIEVQKLLHDAARTGRRPGLTPYNLLVWPQYLGLAWMLNSADDLVWKVGAKLEVFHQQARGILPIHRPLQVLNCNTVDCLQGLREVLAGHLPTGRN